MEDPQINLNSQLLSRISGQKLKSKMAASQDDQQLDTAANLLNSGQDQAGVSYAESRQSNLNVLIESKFDRKENSSKQITGTVGRYEDEKANNVQSTVADKYIDSEDKHDEQSETKTTEGNVLAEDNRDDIQATDDDRVTTSISRETTISLDYELVGPTYDNKEAQTMIVKCQLCSENMKMPKILPCLHSFCESCLEGFVKKLVDRTKTTSVTCPLCHAVALISRNRFNVREYIESLPTSTLISTILSRKAARTRLCSVCKSDSNKAICWCGYCALAFCNEHVQYHKQLTSNKNRHPTVDLDDISSSKSTIMFPYQKCQFHKKEDLHLFCKEEWTPCCHKCRKMLHRHCDVQKGSVVPLSVAAGKVKESKNAKHLKKRLEGLREEAEIVSEDRMKNLDELELQLRLGRESISTIRSMINEHLDQLEDELHDELTEIYEKTRIDLEDERDKAEIKLRTIVHYQNILENIQIHSPEMQAITEMSHLKDQVKNMEVELLNFKRKARTFEISITTYAEYFKQIAKMGALQRRELSAYKAVPVTQTSRGSSKAETTFSRTKTNLYKGQSNSKSTL